MSEIRTSRTRLLAAAASAVLATLALTACGDGTGVKDMGASAAASGPETSGSSGSSGSSDSSGSGSSGSSGSDAVVEGEGGTVTQGGTKSGAGRGGGKKGSRDVVCDGSTTKTVAAPVNRPVNHMLLTVTNTGNERCSLYYYPQVQFTDAQSVPPVIEESKPQAVVSLDPGQSGYAGVSLSAADGSGGDGRTADSLTVYFQGRSGGESVGEGATPSLPAGGVHIDDSLKVTYWQTEMDTALSW
ncbi:DUF4232 domain-containing protein [Streptomyces sp. NPDC088789]|uniref:DUF4232 domain-containing protein n=1 Tax=Streptomyces sp. NPDC088789 TaxID=3365899 RepID=UPI00381D41DC